MKKMALEKKALGCLNEVCSIMCHNYTTWQMSSYWVGVFPFYRKTLALSLWRTPPLLISPMSQQKALCTVFRGRLREKERWHVHIQLLPVYSGAQSVCMYVRSLSVSHSPPNTTRTHNTHTALSLFLSHAHAHPPIDGWGTSFSAPQPGISMFITISILHSFSPSFLINVLKVSRSLSGTRNRKRAFPFSALVKITRCTLSHPHSPTIIHPNYGQCE